MSTLCSPLSRLPRRRVPGRIEFEPGLERRIRKRDPMVWVTAALERVLPMRRPVNPASPVCQLERI